jgi:hypothetical protein
MFKSTHFVCHSTNQDAHATVTQASSTIHVDHCDIPSTGNLRLLISKVQHNQVLQALTRSPSSLHDPCCPVEQRSLSHPMQLPAGVRPPAGLNGNCCSSTLHCLQQQGRQQHARQLLLLLCLLQLLPLS